MSRTLFRLVVQHFLSNNPNKDFLNLKTRTRFYKNIKALKIHHLSSYESENKSSNEVKIQTV